MRRRSGSQDSKKAPVCQDKGLLHALSALKPTFLGHHPQAQQEHSMTERHESTAHERLILALNDPNHLFTADQVAYLMATAGRWSNESPAGESLAYRAAFEAGYQARVAEENATVAKPVWSAEDTKLVTQSIYRKAQEEIAAQPCIGDYLGGPVDWEAKDWRNDVDPVCVQTRKLVPVQDYLNDKPVPHDWPTPAQLPADVRFIRSTTTSMGSAA